MDPPSLRLPIRYRAGRKNDGVSADRLRIKSSNSSVSAALFTVALSIVAFFSGDCPSKAENRDRTKSIVEATTEPGRKAQSPHRCPLERDGDCTLRSLEP